MQLFNAIFVRGCAFETITSSVLQLYIEETIEIEKRAVAKKPFQWEKLA